MRNPFDRGHDDRPELSADASDASAGSAGSAEGTGRHVRPDTGPGDRPADRHDAPLDARHDTAPVIPAQRTAEGAGTTDRGADVRVAGRPATPAPGLATAHDDIE